MLGKHHAVVLTVLIHKIWCFQKERSISQDRYFERFKCAQTSYLWGVIRSEFVMEMAAYPESAII